MHRQAAVMEAVLFTYLPVYFVRTWSITKYIHSVPNHPQATLAYLSWETQKQELWIKGQ